MKDQLLTVQFNKEIADNVYHMSLTGDCSEISRPGQFIDIQVDDFFLRRPISIFDHDDSHVEILYKVVGNGTASLAKKVQGDTLDILLPLGNGFDISKCGKKTLLAAGGIGMPPIYEIAKELSKRHFDMPDVSGHSGLTSFQVLIGFRSADDMFGLDSFKAIGIDPVVATEDGSFGEKGLVTDVMDKLNFDYVMCCGPEPMLKAVYAKALEKDVSGGQFSFEERMGCGFGACMGCTCKTRYGYKRICKDGPVLDMEEILW